MCSAAFKVWLPWPRPRGCAVKNHLAGINLLIIVILLGLSSTPARMRVYTYSLVRIAAAASCGPSYVVRSGDTLSGIARRCGVSTSSLARTNGLNLNSVIYPGQQLAVPGASSSSSGSSSSRSSSSSSQGAASCSTSYTVRSGDTLGSIARRCGVSVANLQLWNGLQSSAIRPGQVLITRAPRSSPRSASPPSSGAQSTATPKPNRAVQATPTPSIESPVYPW